MIDNEVFAIKSNYVLYRSRAQDRLTLDQILREQNSEIIYNLFAKTTSEEGDNYYQMPTSLDWIHSARHGMSVDVEAKNADLITVSRGTGLIDRKNFWIGNPDMPLRITAQSIGMVVLRGYFMTYQDGMSDT